MKTTQDKHTLIIKPHKQLIRPKFRFNSKISQILIPRLGQL